MDLSFVSTSGMIALARLEVASQNLAHQFTLLDAEGITHLTNGVKLSLSQMKKGGPNGRSSRQRDALRMVTQPTLLPTSMGMLRCQC